MTTLFSTQSAPDPGPSSFMVSIVAHGCVLVLALVALKGTPSVHVQPAATRYTVRILKLHTTNPQIHWAAAGSAPPAPTQPTVHTARSGGTPAAPSIPQHLIQQTSARATLVQPNVPLHTLLPLQTPIPLVVMLSPQNVPVPKIVPPPAQKAVTAHAQPSFTLPNHEANVADLKLSAAVAVSSTLPIQPSTTTPIEMHQAAMMKVPQTTSSAAQLPKPATVVSISDLVVMEGTVALPLADETAAASAAELLTPGRSENTAKVGHGNRLGKQSGSGAGNDQQAQGTVGNGAPGRPGASSAGDLASSDGSLAGNQPTVTRITLPKDGRFGVVVVGSSLAEEYPETQATWGNRLAYTVYLHVGATKNWILQYSLPPAVEASGRTTRPDAPWPYMIMRPNLAPGDQDSDAILVHGLVNGEGHFEQLAVVFPPEFPQTKFVLDALQQWQFRPASQNGRSAAVEVLLIIPDASE